MTTAVLLSLALTVPWAGLGGELPALITLLLDGLCFRCVETLDPGKTSRSKILLGLNMYGFDYTSQGGGHVLGRDFVEVCRS